MLALKTFRRLWMGLSTLLGIKTLGYFIPYRYTETVPHYEDRDPYQEIESISIIRARCL